MPASKSPLHAGSARGRDPYTRGPIVGTFVVVVLLHCRRQQANSILPPSPVAGTSCLRHCTRPTAGTAGHRAHATPAVQPATVTLSTLFICQSNNVLHLSLSLSLSLWAETPDHSLPSVHIKSSICASTRARRQAGGVRCLSSNAVPHRGPAADTARCRRRHRSHTHTPVKGVVAAAARQSTPGGPGVS